MHKLKNPYVYSIAYNQRLFLSKERYIIIVNVNLMKLTWPSDIDHKQQEGEGTQYMIWYQCHNLINCSFFLWVDYVSRGVRRRRLTNVLFLWVDYVSWGVRRRRLTNVCVKACPCKHMKCIYMIIHLQKSLYASPPLAHKTLRLCIQGCLRLTQPHFWSWQPSENNTRSL